MNACAFECSGISFYPVAGLKVALVPPQIDVPRQLTVKSFSDNKITFEEVADKKQMQQFDEMHLLVEEDVVGNLKKPECDDFAGWKVIDKTSNKSLKISCVIPMPTQKIAVCEGDVQVVLHEDLIDSVDEENKTIIVVLPDNYFEEF